MSEPLDTGGPPCSGTSRDWLLLSPSFATQPILGMVNKLTACRRSLRCANSKDALPGVSSPWLTLRNSQSEPALDTFSSQLCRLRALPPQRTSVAPSHCNCSSSTAELSATP